MLNKPFWFQLYVMKDRAFVKELIMRARACKVSVLVVTVASTVSALFVLRTLKHLNLVGVLTAPE